MNKRMIQDIIEKSTTIKATDMVSKSKNYLLYDLTDDKKIGVELYKGNKLLRKFFVGAESPTKRQQYFLVGDRPEVYLMDKNFRTDLTLQLNSYRQKVMMEFDSAKVEYLIITDATGKKTEVRKKIDKDATNKNEEVQFYTDKGEKLKEQEVLYIINNLARLESYEFLDNLKKDDFREKNPLYSVVIKADKDYRVDFYEKRGENYLALSSEYDFVFTVSKWTAETIMKPLTELVDK